MSDQPQTEAGAVEAPKGKGKAEPKTATPPATSKFDHELGTFKEFRPSLRRDMGYLADQDPRRVLNVPADMTVTWATHPKIDDGMHIAMMQSLGFRRVRREEVTTDMFDSERMVLRAFEEGPNDTVLVGGGILMIGYRQYRDERRVHAREEARRRLDSNKGRLDNQGVEQRGTTRSAPLSEVM